MAKKMLIDATHPEETRVVVVDGNKVEDFDFESENKRQLAGNIYLAKVTRVEPSLQAAFVDYGGNRHGFLAFSEIHPDYYQIPVADREALMAEERAYAQAMQDEEDKPRRTRSRQRPRAQAEDLQSDDAVESREASIPGMDIVDLDDTPDNGTDDEGMSPAYLVPETPVETPAADESDEDGNDTDSADDITDVNDSDTDNDSDDEIESVAEEDIHDEISQPRKPRPRRYKIQEVIKVRQILLVQVVKEERGNKGAALTTYLSLAGRYCVLMPNTARGGGISRKITNPVDRKKLKEIAQEIDVPDGAGLIVRTAGAQRTKSEIKRDYEYLQRMWEQIRELTLRSIAPAKIYEEGDLIKRSIRDLYNKDIDEVIVEGAAGYRTAKDFMKMIMPSHAKNVINYNEGLPLFARYQVESYLSSMFNPVVQLKSGGYIVIGITEALVAVDVNSGRATKEGSIEETALKTNLEAAEEVARQMRLRDLAGLIVIDFIDMDERRNNLAVEKRLKEKLKTDRARIQVGRISGFGLLEMSRQRLRPGMLEATTQPCNHCHGTGLIRSDDNLGLTILRQLEEEGTRRRSREVLLKAPVGIINFLINNKRENIAQIEARYGMAVRLEADPFLITPDFSIEKFKTATRVVAEAPSHIVSVDLSLMDQIDDAAAQDEDEADTDEVEEAEAAAQPAPNGDEGDQAPRKRRRRRRRRKSGSDDNGMHAGDDTTNGEDDDSASDEADTPVEAPAPVEAPTPVVDAADVTGQPEPAVEAVAESEAPAPKPTRSRTRTRKTPVKADAPAEVVAEAPAEPAASDTVGDQPEAAPAEDAPAAKAPVRKRTTRARATKPAVTEEAATDAAPADTAEKPAKAPAKPRAPRKPRASTAAAKAETAPATQTEPAPAPEATSEPAPAPEPAPEPAATAEPASEPARQPELAETEADTPDNAPKKTGWWSTSS